MSTDPAHLKASQFAPDTGDFGETVAWNDHKIAFVTKYCRGKSVLDIGCVQHNPENYRSRYWLHRAIRDVAREVLGVDLYSEGVEVLRTLGYNVVVADAQTLDLGRTYDVVVAGDLIEHLEDLGGFLRSAARHMSPSSVLLISSPNPWYWRNTVKAALGQEVSSNREHTCWLCPRTLRQLAARHDLVLEDVQFGSRYTRDRLMPLPRGWRHTSFHAALRLDRSSAEPHRWSGPVDKNG